MKEQDLQVKWFNTVFYPQNRQGRPVLYDEKILPRLREKDIIFFTPWGPRYSYASRGQLIQPNDKEIQVLNFLAKIFEQLVSNMPSKNFQWIFLGADLYGSRINRLPNEIVFNYFQSLKQWLEKIMPNAKFYLWSDFDKQAEPYRKESELNLEKILSLKTRQKAIETAKKMGTQSDPKKYLAERLAEAMLIEEQFKPIKISCVGKYKDDEVDYQLPRLYLLPPELHAPWL